MSEDTFYRCCVTGLKCRESDLAEARATIARLEGERDSAKACYESALADYHDMHAKRNTLEGELAEVNAAWDEVALSCRTLRERTEQAEAKVEQLDALVKELRAYGDRWFDWHIECAPNAACGEAEPGGPPCVSPRYNKVGEGK